jgi:predicted nucleic acid-binding protein
VSRILIDTNIYSFALRGASEVVSVLQKAAEIGICAISIGELLSGFKGGEREPENRAELEEFLDAPRVRLYYIDEITADYYAEILNALRRSGKPIPTNDTWIGAVALQHGLRVFSKDKHFNHIPGLMVLS